MVRTATVMSVLGCCKVPATPGPFPTFTLRPLKEAEGSSSCGTETASRRYGEGGVGEQGWAVENFSMDGRRQWESVLHMSRTACETGSENCPIDFSYNMQIQK